MIHVMKKTNVKPTNDGLVIKTRQLVMWRTLTSTSLETSGQTQPGLQLTTHAHFLVP